MVLTVSRFLCQVCGSLQDTFDYAMQCELLPMNDEAQYQVGDELHFQNEESMMGTRYSYSSASGRILHAGYTRVDIRGGGSVHRRFYIVQGNFGNELGVMIVDGEFGAGYMSLAEWKYNSGYAEFRNNQQRLNCFRG